jgi:hypothetical protein
VFSVEGLFLTFTIVGIVFGARWSLSTRDGIPAGSQDLTTRPLIIDLRKVVNGFQIHDQSVLNCLKAQ